MAGEGRPSTSFLDASSTDVDGGAKPRHDGEARAAGWVDSLVSGRALSYAAADNVLFFRPNTMVQFGEAKKMTEEVVHALRH
jgi:hypothetical protein